MISGYTKNTDQAIAEFEDPEMKWIWVETIGSWAYVVQQKDSLLLFFPFQKVEC